MGLVESMSGKLCGHSDMYFFRMNGTDDRRWKTGQAFLEIYFASGRTPSADTAGKVQFNGTFRGLEVYIDN